MSNGVENRTRVYWLRSPIKERGSSFLLVISLGAFLVWIPAYVAMLGLLALLSASNGELPSWVYVLSVFAGIGAMLFFIYWQGTKPYRTAHRKNPLRLDRLKKIFNHPDAGRRLPHRLVEILLRQRKGSTQHIGRILKQSSPNTVVAILPNQRIRLPTWNPSDNHFEPIELNDDADKLLHYVNGEIELAEEDEEENPKRRFFSLQRVKSLTFSAIFYGFAFFFFARIVFNLIYSPTAWLWMIGLVGGVIIVPILGRLLIEKKWWIFPGGLMRRVDAIGRGPIVHNFRPDSCPLIIDFRNEFAAVMDGQRVFRIPVVQQAQLAILAAWTSTARRPTCEELCSFLGVNGGGA